LTKLGDSTGAGKHLETALQLDPQQHLAHNSLGELLMKQEKIDQARSHFEEALRIDPDYSPAKRNLQTLTSSAK
jgi:Tfp pilus assembly protein PilF